MPSCSPIVVKTYYVTIPSTLNPIRCNYTLKPKAWAPNIVVGGHFPSFFGLARNVGVGTQSSGTLSWVLKP